MGSIASSKFTALVENYPMTLKFCLLCYS